MEPAAQSSLDPRRAAERDALVEKLRAFFRQCSGDYSAVYLFGSVARASFRDDSDLDLALIRSQPVERPAQRLHAELAGELERLVDRRVEVIDLEGAPVDLGHRVLRDGILVHEADRSRRVAVETRLRARYLDLAPVLAEYRRLPRER